VAGVAALVFSRNPLLTNQQVRDILDSTAIDLGSSGWDEYYGHGKVNAYAAVEAAGGGGGPPSDTGILTVYNDGDGYLNVSSITKSETWVKSIDPGSFSVAPDGSRGVEVIVSGELSEGVYRDTLFIHSDDSDESTYPVPVILIVGNPGIEEDFNSQPSFAEGNFSTLNSQLLQVYPNPFSTTVAIKLSGYQSTKQSPPHPRTSAPLLRICDLSGRLVRTLNLYNPSKSVQSVSWDGTDNSGKKVKSGIYFICVNLCSNLRESVCLTKKAILIR
jgi:hypothetical protein